MDIINHAAWGYILVKEKKTWTYILFILMGILPDILGWIGLQIMGDYYVYNIVHSYYLFIGFLLIWMFYEADYLLPYLIHLLMDSFTHGENGWFNLFVWWEGWGIIIEVLSWIIIFYIIIKRGRNAFAK